MISQLTAYATLVLARAPSHVHELEAQLEALTRYCETGGQHHNFKQRLHELSGGDEVWHLRRDRAGVSDEGQLFFSWILSWVRAG